MTPASSPSTYQQTGQFNMGWEELGKEAKQLETSIDGRLLQLSQACRQVSPEAGEIVTTVEQELSQLAALIGAMEETLGGEPDHSLKAGILFLLESLNHHLLQRHREIYREYRREHRKLKVCSKLYIYN